MPTVITALVGGDGITTANSMTKINANFDSLNTNKIETSVIDTDTALSANSDSKIPSQKAVKAYVDALGTLAIVPTGAVLSYASATPPTGFLLCDGSPVSRSTYATLFGITSTNFGVGNGSTTFNLPDLRSRFVMGTGTGTKIATFASRSSDTITVTGLTNASNNEFQTGQLVNYISTGSVITGLTSTNNYYVIRVSNTSFKLASSLANAQIGTQISLSSDGTGTQTFTQTLTARTLGDTGGEENHAMSSTELLSHTHTILVNSSTGAGGGQPGSAAGNTSGSPATNPYYYDAATGGNTSMNITSPFVALAYIIKT